LEKNGVVVQRGYSGDMLFKVDQLIAYISKYISLKIGDLIYTGTPAGVGSLTVGDQLKGYIEDEKLIDFQIR
jgi:2-keto-4-pentenoate hydratase/2-oxohepta-3-ene-1,7-dioic acid hydratase in catechol pathway